ncbi:MAG: RidA family protein [Gammaproteobacteria bacterium]|nr:RidA family protein [Gammaproteobacteria bacterium]
MDTIRRIMVPGQMAPISHYCHVVRADQRIWVSGTVGVAADGQAPDSVVAQAELAIANMDAALVAAGGAREHIVKVTVFLTNIADRAAINPIRQRYFGEHRPASTLVEVSALAMPELKVEIEAEAYVPN